MGDGKPESHDMPAGSPDAMPNPGNLTAYRRQIGRRLPFTVTGLDRGSVWVSGVYNDDSTLAVTRVHAGLLAVGETGVGDVRIDPGLSSYSGSAVNGITSANYGSWSGSFSFPRAPLPRANRLPRYHSPRPPRPTLTSISAHRHGRQGPEEPGPCRFVAPAATQRRS